MKDEDLINFKVIDDMPRGNHECMLENFPLLQTALTVIQFKELISKYTGVPVEAIVLASIKQSYFFNKTAITRLIVKVPMNKI